MIRIFFLYFSIFMALSINAQDVITKSIGEFKTLKALHLINIELIKSNENKVEITGEHKDAVIVKNKSGELKIKMKLKHAFDNKGTKVKLYYTHLEGIDANLGAKILTKDPLNAFEIYLKAQEGAEINATVNVTYANIKSIVTGSIILSGTAKKQWASVFTRAQYNGENLQTDQTEVIINTAGTASVFAHKKVIAKIRVGGTITIYGNPEQVDKDIVLGGNIYLE